MIGRQKIEGIISILLLVGIIISAALVLIGGTLFLWQSGYQDVGALPNINQLTLSEIWQFAFSWSPLGMIELGLLLLVMVQVFRVALLCGFYLFIRDYWFMLFSTFILGVLVYSIVWRN